VRVRLTETSSHAWSPDTGPVDAQRVFRSRLVLSSTMVGGGATITHRVLTSLFRERGVHLDRTMQLNVGGNSDFLNMLERERLESKKISKTNAVTSLPARSRARRAT
jgi:hypothetical protein